MSFKVGDKIKLKKHKAKDYTYVKENKTYTIECFCGDKEIKLKELSDKICFYEEDFELETEESFIKFKVGDKVIVRGDLKAGEEYNELLFAKDMEKYKGNLFIIESSFSYKDENIYALKGAEGWSFSNDMLILAQEEEKEEVINHPSHYNQGIEAIDVIESWGLNFSLGNAIKYILRAPHKGKELEDLKKAKWYIEREIKRLEDIAKED